MHAPAPLQRTPCTHPAVHLTCAAAAPLLGRRPAPVQLGQPPWSCRPTCIAAGAQSRGGAASVGKRCTIEPAGGATPAHAARQEASSHTHAGPCMRQRRCSALPAHTPPCISPALPQPRCRGRRPSPVQLEQLPWSCRPPASQQGHRAEEGQRAWAKHATLSSSNGPAIPLADRTLSCPHQCKHPPNRTLS